MNPIIALVVLFSLVAAEQIPAEKATLNEEIIRKYGEQPCLNKVIGQRLTHPTDPHKYLRCMSLEAMWIETCPDGLLYNPTEQICDWSVHPRSSTRSNEVVKHRPVLFKTKVNDGRVINEIVESPSRLEFRTAAESQVDEETSTPSLLDELRKKLNLDTTDRTRVVKNFEDEEAPKSKKSLKSLQQLTREVPESDQETREVPEERELIKKKPSLRLIEVIEKKADDSSDFVVASTKKTRGFLKQSEKKSLESQ